MRFKLGISVVALAFGSLGASRAAHAQVYGPYTFDANSWVTSATLTGYCYPYPAGTCEANVVGHSPAVCGANITCAPGNYLELFFGNATIKNNPGVDLVVFDTRFSIDAASIAVETAPGVFTNYETWAVNEQFAFPFGTGCDGEELVAVPVDLSRFGLPLGFTTQRIRVGGSNATGSCEFDLTMAGVPVGAPVCATDADCNDGNPCTNDACSGSACSYSPSGVPGCTSVCADGIIGTGEACDDGNSAGGDGCSDTCQIEAGYECLTPGAPCTDIDECATGADSCDANAMCINIPGTFTCMCNPGFMGDGVTCVDIDECATEADNCDANAACANAPGAFDCTCNAGFTGDGVTCVDIDECALDTDGCDANAACANLPGSFDCKCNAGYDGNGMTCAAVCGDGIVAGTEACDDANAASGDGCSSACAIEPGWTCGGMPSVCETGECGDGILADVEGCDDGNTAGGDGCTSSCMVQDGWACAGMPSVCGAVACGDGILAGVEDCDDANKVNGDGCADNCSVEEGWTCEGAPSVCSNPCDGARPCGADPVDEGSCACSAPGSGGSSSGIGLAFGLSALLLARRRRAATRTRAR